MYACGTAGAEAFPSVKLLDSEVSTPLIAAGMTAAFGFVDGGTAPGFNQ